jgi:hypothetical protein
MKPVLSVLVLLTLPSIALAQQIYTAPIVEEAVGNSPLENTGVITLTKTIEGSTVARSYSGRWTVKNISSTPIVAFHEKLVVTFADGSGSSHEQIYDMFFGTKDLEPGATQDLSYEPDITERTRYAGSDAPSQKPTSEISERWVQFADGTTFGEAAYGQDILSARKSGLQLLTALNEAYVSEGPEGFVRQLQAQGQASPFLYSLRAFQARGRTQDAIDALKRYLAAAEARKALL